MNSNCIELLTTANNISTTVCACCGFFFVRVECAWLSNHLSNRLAYLEFNFVICDIMKVKTLTSFHFFPEPTPSRPATPTVSSSVTPNPATPGTDLTFDLSVGAKSLIRHLKIYSVLQ